MRLADWLCRYFCGPHGVARELEGDEVDVFGWGVTGWGCLVNVYSGGEKWFGVWQRRLGLCSAQVALVGLVSST